MAGTVAVMEIPSGRQVHEDSKSVRFPEDRAVELSSRLSRFDGSCWISFSSQLDQLVEERVEVPIESRSHEIDPEVLGHFVEELYPTPHIHEQMITSNYGYDTAYNFTHNNIMLEPNAMNNIDTVAHMNVHNTQY